MGPKNRNAKLGSDAKAKNQTIGKHVRYIGLGNNWFVCPNCNRRFLRGFFWEENEKQGCTQTCLKAQIELHV